MIIFDVQNGGITARLMKLPKPETSFLMQENEDEPDINKTNTPSDKGGEQWKTK